MKRNRYLILGVGVLVCLALLLTWFLTPTSLLPHPERAEVLSIRYRPYQEAELRWEKHSSSDDAFAIDEAMEEQILQCLSDYQVRRKLTNITTDNSVYDAIFNIMVRPVKGKSDLLLITLGLDNFAQKNLSWPELTILNGEDVTPDLLELLNLD